ncbi:MAG: ABC transporter permease [Naasia sp.]
MDLIFALFTPEMLRAGIGLSTPILFGAIASALSNRAGVLNLAIEAKMLIGAFVGLFALSATQSIPVAILFAAVAGASTGLMMAGAHRIGVDLIIFAIGLNLLAVELSVYLMRVLFGNVGVWRPEVPAMPDYDIPVIGDIPFVGPLVSGHNALVYLAFLAAIGYAVIFRYRSGRHLLAVGASPKAAAAAGISTTRVQTWALTASGALAGIGGSYLTVGDLGLFTRNMTDGDGWIAVTAALLAMSRPRFIVPAALLFGFSDAFAIRLQSVTDLPQVVVQLIPFVATLVVLAIVGLRTLRAEKTLGLFRPPRRGIFERFRRAPGIRV